jgi:hypothetical protein
MFRVKISILIKYLATTIIICSSLLIFIFVSLPLFDDYINEIDKKKVIGMEPSIPLEFENGNVFWWLVKDSNNLIFHNSGDEKIKGNIILTLESNPCKYSEKVEINYGNQTNQYLVESGKTTKIEVPVEIRSRSSQQIPVSFIDGESCFVSNGDDRNFGAKLTFWSFE